MRSALTDVSGHGFKPGRKVPRQRPRRHLAARSDRPQPQASRSHVQAYDFAVDACANGQQRKCLTIIDEYTRECRAIDVAGSIRSRRAPNAFKAALTLSTQLSVSLWARMVRR